ncbi:hypothetical protein [Nannocystis pusilla]|uniref:hypothetical protein n=1 Tax=Nannocystis pusilla TaxID=889268 RepID=UPI003DA3ADE8
MTRPARALALLPLVAAAAALAVPRPVHACDCTLLGPTFHPPYVPEAFAAAVETSEEVAGLTCRPARRGRLACTWTARYVLTRAVAGDIPLTFAYPTGADLVVRLDGEVVADSLAALDPRFGVAQRELFVTWPAGQASRAVVELRADLLVGPAVCGCDTGRTTNRRRHPKVSPAGLPRYAVVYQPQAQPESVRLSLDFRRPWREHRPALFPGGKGRRITRDIAKRGDDPVSLGFKAPLRLDPGGPIVGVGLGFSPEGLRPRLRLGWELAWPRNLGPQPGDRDRRARPRGGDPGVGADLSPRPAPARPRQRHRRRCADPAGPAGPPRRPRVRPPRLAMGPPARHPRRLPGLPRRPVRAPRLADAAVRDLTAL